LLFAVGHVCGARGLASDPVFYLHASESRLTFCRVALALGG
jgi:hypothetical protein